MTCFDDTKILIIEISTPNQSGLGWYGQGHSHDQLRADGEDAVLPSMGILLVTAGSASHVSPTHDWSLKMSHFMPKNFFGAYGGFRTANVCKSFEGCPTIHEKECPLVSTRICGLGREIGKSFGNPFYSILHPRFIVQPRCSFLKQLI